MKLFITIVINLFILVFYNPFPDKNISFDSDIGHNVIIKNGKIENSEVKRKADIGRIASTYNLTIAADFEISYLWIYNDSFDYFEFIENSIHTITLPSETYHIFLGTILSPEHHEIITRENFILSNDSTINFSESQANILATYTFRKSNYDSLNINTISFYFFNGLINKNLRISFANFNSTEFQLSYNKIPSYFDSEWVVKGKQKVNEGDLYLLSNSIKFPAKDSTITNDPDNLAYADFFYNLPDSVTNKMAVQLFTLIPDFHTYDRLYDPLYNFPMTQRIYQDTVINKSRKSSKFWQGVIVETENIFLTTEIRISKDKVFGFHFRDSLAPPFVLSETKQVQLGVMPTFWYGKFFNKTDSIKIRSPYGMWHFPFLSLSNDILYHKGFIIHLFSNNEWYDSKPVSLLYGNPGLRLGFKPEDLTLYVIPDRYRLEIEDDQNEIVSLKAKTTLMAEFDLRNNDKNPPNILSYQILSGNILSNSLHGDSSNTIRFIARDDNKIKDVNVYYKNLDNDSMWVCDEISFDNGYYKTKLPILKQGYYSLKTYISDSSDNFIEMLMEPAFYIDNTTSIESQYTLLFSSFDWSAYPNPFNSEINIMLDLPSNFKKEISLEVYNTIGQKIKTVFNGFLKNGKGNFILSMSGKQSSGLYYLVLKGGDQIKAKKILFLK